MKFEIADWKLEVTWNGLLMQPLERGRTKTSKQTAAQPARRNNAINRQGLGLAANSYNGRRKGAAK